MSGHKGLERDLAHTIRRLYERGVVSGVGGNASALLPGGKAILITPSGFFKGGVAEGDIVRVGVDGEVRGPGLPSSELATHLATYKVRKDVNAVVHGHPPTAVGLITAGIPIPIMTPEHAVLINKIDIVDFVVPGEDGAKAMRRSLEHCDLVGIKNHGFFSLGPDLHIAASRLEVIEESAKIFETARKFGKVEGLGSNDISKIRKQYAQAHKMK
jgi:L-fuculose-phosphate aldolase